MQKFKIFRFLFPADFEQAVLEDAGMEVRSPPVRRMLSGSAEPSPTRRQVADETQGALRRSADDEVPHAAKLARTDQVNHVSDAKHRYFYDGLDVVVVVDEDVDLLESWEMDDETNGLLEFDEMSFRERSEGEGPPELEAHELEALDAKATIEEIDRLRQIGVIDSADGQRNLKIWRSLTQPMSLIGGFVMEGGSAVAELLPGNTRPIRPRLKSSHLRQTCLC